MLTLTEHWLVSKRPFQITDTKDISLTLVTHSKHTRLPNTVHLHANRNKCLAPPIGPSYYSLVRQHKNSPCSASLTASTRLVFFSLHSSTLFIFFISKLSHSLLLVSVHEFRLLHGILGSPLSRSTIVSGTIRLEQLGNIGHQGIVRVGIRQERTNTEQDLANGQCWTPLVLQDIETDSPVGVDVAVVDTCGKVNLGRLEGIVGREVNIQEKDTARIR